MLAGFVHGETDRRDRPVALPVSTSALQAAVSVCPSIWPSTVIAVLSGAPGRHVVAEREVRLPTRRTVTLRWPSCAGSRV